jgi:hypothetical protein
MWHFAIELPHPQPGGHTVTLSDIAVIVSIIASLVNAGTFFFWAGKVTQKTNDHEGRLARLEDWRDKL